MCLSQEQEARRDESGEKRQLLTTPTWWWRRTDCCTIGCSVHTLTVSSEEQVATAEPSDENEAHHTRLECPINVVISIQQTSLFKFHWVKGRISYHACAHAHRKMGTRSAYTQICSIMHAAYHVTSDLKFGSCTALSSSSPVIKASKLVSSRSQTPSL